MEDLKPASNENPRSKPNELLASFDNSLQELKGLRSQLHNAAGYCEKTFFKTNDKKMVMENTKDYICQALISVIDHLGSVSSNLERHISENDEISNSELRMLCLKQRLLTCQQYAQNLALSKVRGTNISPRYIPHCIIRQNSNVESKEDISLICSSSILDSKTTKIISISPYRNPHKPFWHSKVKNVRNESISGYSGYSGFGFLSKILPSREVTPSPSIDRNPYFIFQAENKKQNRSKQIQRFMLIGNRSKRKT